MSITDPCRISLADAQITEAAGESLAHSLYRFPLTLLLRGELGAGKTTFALRIASAMAGQLGVSIKNVAEGLGTLGRRGVEGAGGVEICVVRGHPARTIVRFATDEACDLIVMATHGSRGLQHALLGSVTDKIIRQVHCPVLVVRLHDPERPDLPTPR